MAQSKLNDLAGKFKAGGGPPGLGLGLKVLAGLGLAAYTASQSVYTGRIWEFHNLLSTFRQYQHITWKQEFSTISEGFESCWSCWLRGARVQ